MAANEAIRPFTLSVADEAIADLRRRLGATRLPSTIEASASGWTTGTNLPFMEQLLDYWRDKYDWRVHEKALNAFPQFVTAIDGIDIHFYHIRSNRTGATPLLLLHGWPGSVYEFHEAMKLLSTPAADEIAFDIVVPSLPGYGFSSAATKEGMDVRAMARLFVALMARLRYDRYVCQGGDWGSLISQHVADIDKAHCAAIHLNFLVGLPPSHLAKALYLAALLLPGINRLFYTADDIAAFGRLRGMELHETGYQKIQATKPQTLAYALVDSPAGLAAWMVEKFHGWSDCRGDLTTRFTMDQLITSISIYWFNGSMASAVRLYRESTLTHRFGPINRYLATPTGCLAAKEELARLPRPFLNANFNVVHYTALDRGGHFIAMEEPKLFVDDVRAFASKVAKHLGNSSRL